MKNKILQSIVALSIFIAVPALFAQQILGTNATVTQGTSTTTGVTIAGNSGVITTFSESAAAGASVRFTVTNSAVTPASTVIANVVNYAGTYGTNGLPVVTVNNIVAGAFDVNVSNAHSANALSGAVKIGFVVF